MLIVTLTSYPGRINIVHKTILSILKGTKVPDKIILWLASDEFDRKEIPEKLSKLADSRRFEILWVDKSLRSYMKLIPSLEYFGNDNHFITIDDDKIYPHFFIEGLLYESQKNANNVISYRAKKVSLSNKKFQPYSQFKTIYNPDKTITSKKFIQTGVGGCLYPPNTFNDEVINKDFFMEFLPTTDDLWFWTMTLLNNKSISVIKSKKKISQFILPNKFKRTFKTIKNSQGKALRNDNLASLNDKSLNILMKRYKNLFASL